LARKNKIYHSGLNNFFRNGKRILFSHGNRHLVYDTEGNHYNDFILGFGPVIIGHNNPQFQEKFTPYLKNGIIMPGYSKWHSLYLERLLSDLREELTGLFFKTASEAVLGAIRLCSALTKKKGIIRCGYIGWHDIQIGDSIKWHEPLDSPLRKQIRYESDLKLGIRSFNKAEPIFNWIDFDLNNLEALLRKNGDMIGSMVIDIYQLFFTNEKIIKESIELCHKYEIMVIFDETKTGGRVYKHGIGITEKYNMDLVIFGKSLANGAPISLIIGNENLLKYSELTRITGTFSKEMLSIYCALATLEFMEENSGIEKISSIGMKFEKIFNNSINKLGLDSLIKLKPVFNGSMFDVSFAAQLLAETDIRGALVNSLLEHNILILQGHPSFFCYDHSLLDWSVLNLKIVESLEDWMKILNPFTGNQMSVDMGK